MQEVLEEMEGEENAHDQTEHGHHEMMQDVG
jgi:hypothetical protein